MTPESETTPETTQPAAGVASYNITNDRLRVWFDCKLPHEEYEAFRKAGFVYWFGSKCLTTVWSTRAEDMINGYGIEIEEDDSPDDTEARVERFGKYAARHEANAEGAESYLASDRCNTDRRRKNAINALERGSDTAAYWQRRIAASIAHAEFKENPGLIMRRIDGLESDLRKQERWLAEPERDGNGNCWFKGFGRGGSWTADAAVPAIRVTAQRWIDHLNMRLTYERALLAASGDIRAQLASNEVQLEVGGAVMASRTFGRSCWKLILTVNDKTLDIWDRTSWRNVSRIDRSNVTAIKSKSEVEAGGLDIDMPPAEELAKLNAPKTIEKATTRDGKRPEKWGAVGVGGYGCKEADAEWCLIVKVNAKTFEYVYEHTEQVLAGGKIETRTRLLKKSDLIRYARFLKTPAEAEQMPELVSMKARVVAIDAKKKERKAAEKAEKEGDA